MMSSQHRFPARCPSESTCADSWQNHYGDESGQQWNYTHCASFTPSHAVDEASKDLLTSEIRSSCFCFVPRVPAHIQHALPDMIFWLTSASGLNHVLTTLQTSSDSSIGGTACAMFDTRITAECIDHCKAGLSCCVPAPSFRRCDRPQLDRQDEACFHLLSRALRCLASSLPDKQFTMNSAANSSTHAARLSAAFLRLCGCNMRSTHRAIQPCSPSPSASRESDDVPLNRQHSLSWR